MSYPAHDPHPDDLAARIQQQFGVALGPDTHAAISAATATHRNFGAPAAPHLTLGSALPQTFWQELGGKVGPLALFVAQSVLSAVPLSALTAGAGSLAAALPGGFLGTLVRLLGPVLVDVLKQLLEKTPVPSAPAAPAAG